jgi:hypothetical protein
VLENLHLILSKLNELSAQNKLQQAHIEANAKAINELRKDIQISIRYIYSKENRRKRSSPRLYV